MKEKQGPPVSSGSEAVARARWLLEEVDPSYRDFLKWQDEGAKTTPLDEAKRVIYGDREKTYGDPSKNLNRIAELWSQYLQKHLREWIRRNWRELGDTARARPNLTGYDVEFDSFLRNVTQWEGQTLNLNYRDTCRMMQLLKWARDENEEKEDNVVDDLGYGALVHRCRTPEYARSIPIGVNAAAIINNVAKEFSDAMGGQKMAASKSPTKRKSKTTRKRK